MMRKIFALPPSVNNMVNFKFEMEIWNYWDNAMKVILIKKKKIQSHHNCCGGWSHHLKRECLCLPIPVFSDST